MKHNSNLCHIYVSICTIICSPALNPNLSSSDGTTWSYWTVVLFRDSRTLLPPGSHETPNQKEEGRETRAGWKRLLSPGLHRDPDPRSTPQGRRDQDSVDQRSCSLVSSRRSTPGLQLHFYCEDVVQIIGTEDNCLLLLFTFLIIRRLAVQSPPWSMCPWARHITLNVSL